MALKPITKASRTMWCGPSALAILTGLTYEEAYAKALRAMNRYAAKRARERRAKYGAAARPARRYTAIKGMQDAWMPIVGKALKLKIEWSYKLRGTTLVTFVDMHTVKGKTYLVVSGNHYMVVQDGLVYDNGAYVGTREGRAPRDMARATVSRLDGYAEVRPRPEALLP